MANKRLNAIIEIGGTVSGTLRSAIGSTTSQLSKIGSEITKVKNNQRQLGDAIKTFGGMGKDVDNLRTKYAATVTELKKLESAQSRLNKVESARLQNSKKFAELQSQIGAAVATAATMTAPVVMAAKFETAMLGVAKQLEGARDQNGNLTKTYFDMQKQVQLLGRELPIATNEIAAMVSAGLRMGIAGDEVVGFTRKTAEMATAFELPVEELADNMGKIANMYKIPIPAIGDLADSINYLDDNAIAKGGDIIDFMQRVGGTAAMVKVSSKETAALGSTLLTLGEKSETASTAINAVFSKLGAANTQSKPFKEMVKELGMSTGELGRGMQTNAIGTIFKVMDEIKKLPKLATDGKTSQIDAVATLFGAEHWDTFSKLLENRGELEKQIALANSTAAKGSMGREFQARMATTEAQWATLKNRASELTINVGSVLLPAVNSVMSQIGSVVSIVADWSQANPALTRTIVTAAVALGTFKIGLLATRLAIVAIKSPLLASAGMFAKLQSGLAISRISFTSFMPVIKQVGFALLRTPWGLAAAAAIAAGLMIYKYWDHIKAFFSGFWTGLQQGIAPFKDAVIGLVAAVPLLGRAWDLVSSAVSTVFTWFTQLLAPVNASKEQIAGATNAGVSFGNLVGGAINLVLAPLKLVVNLFTWIMNNAGKVIGMVQAVANSNVAQKIGGAVTAAKNFVTGGGVSKPPTSIARPAQKPPQVRGAQSFMGSQSNSFAPSFTINAAPGQSPDQIADAVMRKQKQAQGVQQRSSMVDWGYAQ